MVCFLNEFIIMTASARVCRATSRTLTCHVENDVEDTGSARAQNSAKFLHALVAVLLWYVVRFFVVYCVCVVYCVFVLWYVCACLSKAVLEWFFFTARRGWQVVGSKGWLISRRGRDCGCGWTRSRHWCYVIGADFRTLSGDFFSPPRCAHSKWCAQSFVLNHMLWSKLEEFSYWQQIIWMCCLTIGHLVQCDSFKFILQVRITWSVLCLM